MSLPAWDSASSVGKIHDALEVTGLVFFALLVAFDILAKVVKSRASLLEWLGLACFTIAVLAEICALPYGRHSNFFATAAANIAEQKIAALNKEAAEARLKAGRAEVAAGEANARAAALEIESATLMKQLGAQQRRADVMMEPMRQNRFLSHIKRFSGQPVDVVSCRIKESEMVTFTMSILSMLNAAKWKVVKVEDSPSCNSGLIVLINSDASQRAKEAAQALLDAFKKEGLASPNAIAGPTPTQPPGPRPPGTWYLEASEVDSVLVVVGPHP
jgi:hypothetical protein